MLLTLFLLHFLNDGIRTAFVSLLPFIAKEFQMSYAVVGILGASQGLFTSLLSLPAGVIASRIGGLKLLTIALLIYTIGAFIISASPTVFLIGFAFYFAGVGFGLFHSVGYALVARVSPQERIGRNMGNFTAVGDLGRIGIPAVSLFLVLWWGWRATILVLGLAGAAALIFVGIKYLRQRQEPNLTTPTAPESLASWFSEAKKLLRKKELLLIASAGVIDNFAGNPVYIFLPFLLIAKGFSPESLGLFVTTYFLGSFFGKSALGRAVDTFGNAKIFIIAEFIMSSGLILFTLLNQTIVLIPLIFLLGLFTRGTTPVISALLSSVSHEKHYEKLYAISETMFGMTAALSPVLLGILADTTSVTTVFYVMAVFAVISTFPIWLYTKHRAQAA